MVASLSHETWHLHRLLSGRIALIVIYRTSGGNPNECHLLSIEFFVLHTLCRTELAKKDWHHGMELCTLWRLSLHLRILGTFLCVCVWVCMYVSLLGFSINIHSIQKRVFWRFDYSREKKGNHRCSPQYTGERKMIVLGKKGTILDLGGMNIYIYIYIWWTWIIFTSSCS